PHLAHGRMVRSTYAHAKLLSVDVSQARELPGVLAVITGSDIAHWPNVSTGPVLDMPLLAVDKVRYSGEPIAAVIAVDERIAAEAVDLVQVEYEPLPVVLDVEEAAAEGAPPIHDDCADG